MPGRSKEEGEEVKQKWPSKKKLIVWTVLSNRKRRRRFPVFVLGGECVRVCECVCVVSSAFFIIVGGCVYEGESTIFGVCTHTHTDPTRSPIHGKIGTDLASNSIIREREREIIVIESSREDRLQFFLRSVVLTGQSSPRIHIYIHVCPLVCQPPSCTGPPSSAAAAELGRAGIEQNVCLPDLCA